MSNTKISALTSATTPLAGTETLPIVQSSTTKQVSVANLTAGRAVTGSSFSATSKLFASTSAGTGGVNIGDRASGSSVFEWYASSGPLYLYSYSEAANVLTYTAGTGLTFNTGNLIQGTAAKGVNFTANTPAAGMTSQLLNWYEEGTWTARLATGFTTTPTTTGYYTRVGRQVTITCVLSFGVIVNNGAAITVTGVPFSAANPVDGVFSGQRVAFSSSNSPFIQLSGTTISFYEVVPSSPTVNALTSSSGAGNAPVLGNISLTYFV